MESSLWIFSIRTTPRHKSAWSKDEQPCWNLRQVDSTLWEWVIAQWMRSLFASRLNTGSVRQHHSKLRSFKWLSVHHCACSSGGSIISLIIMGSLVSFPRRCIRRVTRLWRFPGRWSRWCVFTDVLFLFFWARRWFFCILTIGNDRRQRWRSWDLCSARRFSEWIIPSHGNLRHRGIKTFGQFWPNCKSHKQQNVSWPLLERLRWQIIHLRESSVSRDHGTLNQYHHTMLNAS